MSSEQNVGWVERSAAPPSRGLPFSWWGSASLDPPYILTGQSHDGRSRPLSACAETPVNGRFILAVALPAMSIFILSLSFGCGADSYDKQPAETETPADESDDSAEFRWPKVTISKETTYFTEPLRPDGGMDYVAAFNKRLSEGVTPENNALIPLLRATGPNTIDKKIRKRYFEMLGIAELPEKGNYLIYATDLPEYKEAEKQSGNASFSQCIWGQYQEAVKTPWSAQDYPFWATALERNENLLDMIVEGLLRSKLYSPLVSENEPSFINECNFTAVYNPLIRVKDWLSVRAMHRLHEGDVSGAWQDLMAHYRLQRLWSRQPLVSDRFSIEAGYQFVSSTAVSQYDRLTAEQARECQQQYCSLPMMFPLKELCNKSARCTNIESVLSLANHVNGNKSLEDIEKDIDGFYFCEEAYDILVNQAPEFNKLLRRKEAIIRLLAEKDVDWTDVLRHYNAWYNRIVEAVSCPKYIDGDSMLKTLKADTLRQANQTAELVLSKNPEEFSNYDSETKDRHVAQLIELPSFVRYWREWLFADHRRQARENMVMLTFALAGYRVEHDGNYPKMLAELAPKYIDTLPKDPFNNQSFHYKAENGGYLLYSVGKNGKDNDGRGQIDYPESVPFEERTEWDDISIRTPQKTN